MSRTSPASAGLSGRQRWRRALVLLVRWERELQGCRHCRAGIGYGDAYFGRRVATDNRYDMPEGWRKQCRFRVISNLRSLRDLGSERL